MICTLSVNKKSNNNSESLKKRLHDNFTSLIYVKCFFLNKFIQNNTLLNLQMLQSFSFTSTNLSFVTSPPRKHPWENDSHNQPTFNWPSKEVALKEVKSLVFFFLSFFLTTRYIAIWSLFTLILRCPSSYLVVLGHLFLALGDKNTIKKHLYGFSSLWCKKFQYKLNVNAKLKTITKKTRKQR